MKQEFASAPVALQQSRTLTMIKINGTQTQTFHYDALDRLTSAYADGGTNNEGDYASSGSPEQYQYSASTGNLISKAGVSSTYNAQVSGCTGGGRTIANAVSVAGSNSYGYDCNGNMTQRVINGSAYNLSYDAENRLTGVSGPGLTASFDYDGGGNRVKGTVAGVTTTYIGNYFEWTGSTNTMNCYYYAGGVRIAMRTGNGSETGLLWLLGDHLGSTSRVANPDGTPYPNGEQRYKPWGEQRFPSGPSGLPTTYRFTGQREIVTRMSEIIQQNILIHQVMQLVSMTIVG